MKKLLFFSLLFTFNSILLFSMDGSDRTTTRRRPVTLELNLLDNEPADGVDNRVLPSPNRRNRTQELNRIEALIIELSANKPDEFATICQNLDTFYQAHEGAILQNNFEQERGSSDTDPMQNNFYNNVLNLLREKAEQYQYDGSLLPIRIVASACALAYSAYGDDAHLASITPPMMGNSDSLHNSRRDSRRGSFVLPPFSIEASPEQR